MAEGALNGGVVPLAGAERNQVVLHVDLETVAGGSGPGREGAANLEQGPMLSPATARRLCCDASIVTLIERGGEPLSVGRRTRAVPPAIDRALRARDRTCRFPGCENHRFVDAHHIRHWARGGETSLDNLIRLCRHHHRLVHEGGYSVKREGNGNGAEIVFRRPGGSPIERSPIEKAIRADARPLPRLVSEPSAGVPPGYETLDLDHAVLVLAAQAGPDRA